MVLKGFAPGGGGGRRSRFGHRLRLGRPNGAIAVGDLALRYGGSKANPPIRGWLTVVLKKRFQPCAAHLPQG